MEKLEVWREGPLAINTAARLSLPEEPGFPGKAEIIAKKMHLSSSI
jgi:hypothetical protein